MTWYRYHVPGGHWSLKPLCKVYYTYTAEGQHFSQCDYFKKADLGEFKAGEKEIVLYRVDLPGVARLLRPGEKLPAGVALADSP